MEVFLFSTKILEILRIANPKIPLSVNKITAETPGAPIATLRITVDKINPVFLAKFPKSTVNRYDKSKIKISANISIVKKSEKKISLLTSPLPSITANVQVPNEYAAITMKATNNIKEIIVFKILRKPF